MRSHRLGFGLEAAAAWAIVVAVVVGGVCCKSRWFRSMEHSGGGC